jgi:hypothetical protein
MKKILTSLVVLASIAGVGEVFAQSVNSIQQKCIKDCKRQYPGIDEETCKANCNSRH